MQNYQSNNKRLKSLENTLQPTTKDRLFLIDEPGGLVRVGDREIPYETFKKLYPGPSIILHTGAFNRRISTWLYEGEIMKRDEGRPDFDQELIEEYEKKYLGVKK